MSYVHLTINERTKIETLFHLGWSARAIALHIKRHHATQLENISRSDYGRAVALELTI